LGMFIFLVYKKTYSGVMYSASFGTTLVALTMITTVVILAVTSNVVLSLGMVGALSIVRFRTAIKEPMDLVFLFWSIATGIVCGAGLAEIAAVLAFVLTILLFVLDRLPVGRAPRILLVSATGYDVEEAVMTIVRKYCRHYTVKSRTLSGGQSDLVVEVRTDKEAELEQEVAALSAVISSSLLSHDGEVTY
ncbi:MAG: DUF4956 domain-containing protein, partial [Treponema sp.]|nr:DUF4956 domain-containing protein [Treponema sp.]